MKLKKYIYGAALGALSLTYTSCYNADKDFPDYEGGTTAYFAYQYPVRTLILGNDIYDNTLDNAHKCQIWSTMGGAYGGRDAYVQIAVVDSLCDNLFFTDEGGNPDHNNPVRPMPSNYYKLMSNVIPYNGDSRGYVEVQFTDEFFKDPKAVENAYVIPLLMTGVTGIDRILTGTPLGGYTPARNNTKYWDILAKDYVLYCVKYMNPWQAKYIRRGVDEITDGTTSFTNVRKDFKLVNSDPEHYTENPVNQNDEVCAIKTKTMTQAIFPVSVKRANDAASVICNLILTFDGNKCTISSDDEKVTATGSGEFITQGTTLPQYKEYQWGSMNGELVQRDILRLEYKINIEKGKVLSQDKDGKDVLLNNNIDVTTADTLVVQTRESNQRVFFNCKYVQ